MSRPVGTRVRTEAVRRYELRPPLLAADGSVPLSTFLVARQLAARMGRRAADAPPVLAAELAAMGLLDEILRRVVELYHERVDPAAMATALDDLRGARVGPPTDATLAAVEQGFRPPGDGALPEAAPDLLEDLLHVWLANANPALARYRELVDDADLAATAYDGVVAGLGAHFRDRPAFGPRGESLIELLRAPALAAPDSLADQLRFIRDHWRAILGDELDRLLVHLDVLAEEQLGLWRRLHPGGPGGGGEPGAAAGYAGLDAELERFSPDQDWMPRVVLMAKSTYVWLDQLSRRYGRAIHHLDQVPDEELDRLASWGVTGLWLIGLWQRSRASETIKRRRGNPEAVASAYSLDDYRIADDVGGEGACANLRARAWTRGIRLASDMVPNHLGIDSRWVIEHPDRFLSLAHPPYPGYTFGGPDLSSDERVGISIEDHYWDASDAAVVFQRVDRSTGDTRYVYHGNDGTSFPWNDTAQLDYSHADVREAVIEAILGVARRFPIIRFDAAMTLAKKHVQRLWFPEPGHGGAIPSRAEHGTMTKTEFDRAMPEEFWRQVVDRVAAEVPGTLLLAEAFWLMEGYFVRTLGMHRVYNSAFMHMLRDENNAGFRKLIRDTLEFDPEILKRYVNFMNNPDEKTAVEQFGKGDKYFGVATVLATLPGLPMLGHGQVEGFGEKYGMEYRRAYHDEAPDLGLVEHHERVIFPLLHRRAQFAEVAGFLLYDFETGDGAANEDVFAYSNVGPWGERSLVVYHNRFATVMGRIHRSVPFAVKGADGSKRLDTRMLGDGLGLSGEHGMFAGFRDAQTGLEYIRSASELRERGLWVELTAYACHVFVDFRQVRDGASMQWARLAERLEGRGVRSLEESLRELQLEPVHAPLRAVLAEALPSVDAVRALGVAVAEATGTLGSPDDVAAVAARRLAALDELRTASRSGPRTAPGRGKDPLAPLASTFADPWHLAVLATWAVLEPLGRLARGTMAGPTIRAWYDEFRLGPIVAAALRGRGLDEPAAWRAAEQVRMLLALPRPSNVGGRASAGRVRRLVDAWLAHPDVRSFLRLNTWEGVEWVGRDEWRELLDWALLVDAVDGADVRVSRAVLDRLLAAGEEAGYRVDRLREAVAAPVTSPRDRETPER